MKALTVFFIAAIACVLIVFASISFKSPESTGIGIRSYAYQDSAISRTNSTLHPTALTTTIANNQKVHIRYFLPISSDGNTGGVKFKIAAPVQTSIYATYKIFSNDSLLLSKMNVSADSVAVITPTGDGFAEIEVTAVGASSGGSGNVQLYIGQSITDSDALMLWQGAFAEIVKF